MFNPKFHYALSWEIRRYVKQLTCLLLSSRARVWSKEHIILRSRACWCTSIRSRKWLRFLLKSRSSSLICRVWPGIRAWRTSTFCKLKNRGKQLGIVELPFCHRKQDAAVVVLLLGSLTFKSYNIKIPSLKKLILANKSFLAKPSNFDFISSISLMIRPRNFWSVTSPSFNFSASLLLLLFTSRQIVLNAFDKSRPSLRWYLTWLFGISLKISNEREGDNRSSCTTSFVYCNHVRSWRDLFTA